jgi:hypothetical protein
VLNGRSIAALLLLTSACGTSPETRQLREAVAARTAGDASAVAFRFATRRGADVRLYRLPALDEASWRFDTPGLVAERVVGFAVDEDAVYVLSPDHQLLALDLTSGRARTADTAVTFAALGPTGAVLLAHQDQSADRLVARRLALLGRVPRGATLTGVWGTTGDRGLVAVAESGALALYAASGGALAERRPVPAGQLAVAPWGDIAAVATDSDVTVIDLQGTTRPRRLRLGGAPLAVTFSASGHRLFVATDEPDIEAFDRFALTRVGKVGAPAPVTALRADPFGHFLLGQTDGGVALLAEGGDSVLVVPGSWQDDLPATAPDGTLLLRRGSDVVALGPDGRTERGRVRDGAGDRWLVVPWDARRPALQLAARQQPGPSATPAAGHEIYLQVSSTSNPQWADGLARDLKSAGVRASVLPPRTADEMYRVVIGPYATRDEAETIGRTLGMPYWIFTRDSAGGAP